MKTGQERSTLTSSWAWWWVNISAPTTNQVMHRIPLQDTTSTAQLQPINRHFQNYLFAYLSTTTSTNNRVPLRPKITEKNTLSPQKTLIQGYRRLTNNNEGLQPQLFFSWTEEVHAFPPSIYIRTGCFNFAPLCRNTLYYTKLCMATTDQQQDGWCDQKKTAPHRYPRWLKCWHHHSALYHYILITTTIMSCHGKAFKVIRKKPWEFRRLPFSPHHLPILRCGRTVQCANCASWRPFHQLIIWRKAGESMHYEVPKLHSITIDQEVLGPKLEQPNICNSNSISKLDRTILTKLLSPMGQFFF